MARLDPLNRSRYSHAPNLPGMGMLHADFTTHEYAPHVHDSFVIAVTEAGGSEFKSRGRTDVAHQQALLVFNPDEPHSGRMGGSSRWRYRSFYLAEPGIRYLMTTLGIDQTRYFGSNTFRDPQLIASFLEFHRAFDGDCKQWDQLRQQELFVRSFGTLFENHAREGQRILPVPAGADVLAPALELMRDTFSQRLTLEAIAAAANLTPFQLIGAFKRTIGMTPHMYLTQLRLKAAISHLAAGRSLIEVAVASGFYDQSAFTRHFKRSFGMTPLQYVRARHS